jgi:sugar (pentulose or hexulose) kinase
MPDGWTVVLDVGKSVSKATLWDEGGMLRARRSRPNPRLEADGCGVLDSAGIERWLVSVLAKFAACGPVDAIVPVAHGAGAALLHRNRLQSGPLDYEWSEVAADRPSYDRQRDPFEFTGSPALPAGLNLGVQLHWLESLGTANFRSSTIVPWAQYWAWVLSGVPACEVSSLGCHTDLWRPFDDAPSHLAAARGCAEQFAPRMPAHTVLGTLRKEWVDLTGLPPNVQVLCGLHDSNAALLAARGRSEIEGRDATVLSTGTWFVAMRSSITTRSASERTAGFTAPGTTARLAEGRDCLVNVDVNGAPVPSARFMGGRELELLNAKSNAEPAIASAVRVIIDGDMILPTTVPGVGPFPNARHRNLAFKNSADMPALAQIYAALVTDVSLDLIGSCDCLIIEGRFAQAPVFTRVLASLRRDTRIWVSNIDDGVAQGALSLLNRSAPKGALERIAPLEMDTDAYRARWREAADRNEHPP